MDKHTMTTPVAKEIVEKHLASMGITDMSKATIRELSRLASEVERESGQEFIHMEMGVPGLKPSEIGVEAEVKALREGCAQKYPPVDGFPELKRAVSLFVKNFIGIEVSPEGCVPTVGSMQGGMAAFLLVNRCKAGHDRVLFIDPGFPVQKTQLRILGMEYDTFDVYNYRGGKLHDKLESYLKKGRTSAILYSNPNNPSWVCLTEEELETIGKLSQEYDVPIVEDLAYFCMDFRKDLSKPGEPPYQPTVARYCDKWIMLISGSKAFSYAGQRIGTLVVSDTLRTTKYEELAKYFPSDVFGRALVYGAMYGLSSGVASSVQRGFTALLEAANAGEYDFVNEVREYGRRAEKMRAIFEKFGFRVVYDRDGDVPLANGFYFTLSYPGLNGGELLRALIEFGVSAISLGSTGSERTEGLRACVSHVPPTQYELLESRMAAFQRMYGGTRQ